MSETQRAARQQSLASDPTVSAFVSASAGSGKTKLLIDRLLRLMLPARQRLATPPERILCLTFTKAGAAEMAIRLRRTLGAWVSHGDAELDIALEKLELEPSPALRDAARALFAQVLDSGAGMGGGGIRIGTIHAFCESLLRRFPLEAQISPHFRMLEETDGAAALETAREGPLGRAEHAGAVALLAARLQARAHGALTRRLQGLADRLSHAHALAPDALRDTLREALQLAADDVEALGREAADGMDRAALRSAFAAMAERGTPKMGDTARAGLALLNRHDADAWAKWFLTGDGKPRQVPASNTKLAKERPDIGETFRREAERLVAIEGRRRAVLVVEATAALLTLSGPALAAYAEGKQREAMLDFDDLIGATERLLADPGTAWVLFKLDGGLDHLLLDEVQDTSASQWKIAGKLTEEFFAGSAANPNPRTVFAVGDAKQSIYAFQGADPAGFHHWREVFRERVTQAGGTFREPELNVSFRSAAAILRCVDAVFAAGEARDGVVAEGATLHHRSAHPELRGRVELWPLACPDEAQPASASSPWDTIASTGGRTGDERLAAALAGHLAGLVAAGEVAPRDVLILVRRRGAFARLLMRELKAREVPVAGLDRMVLTDQLAISDILAFCDALLLPDDDLAFATFLTSPLGGLDDESLMALALGRPASLRARLAERRGERPEWDIAHRFFDDRFRRADFATPHALLVDILGTGGGRARFLARLGPEAGEAIDELLAAALAHAQAHVPSLQGFVQWVRLSGSEVKREAGETADEIRLMTVHGAKGLEAPFVVLADTTSLPRPSFSAGGGDLLWAECTPGPLPIWVPAGLGDCAAVSGLAEAAEREMLAEYNRLLYVALTRAKTRLLIVGAQPKRGRDLPERCWYELCAAGLAALPGTEEAAAAAFLEGWSGRHLVHGAALGTPAATVPIEPLRATALPGWLGRAPPPEPTPRRALAPSRPHGVEWGPAPPATSPRARLGRAAARARGTVLHALLQHLAALPPEARDAAAHRFAAARLDEGAAAVAAEALRVIADPRLARVFGPAGRAEQRLAGLVGGIAVSGVVDRVAIGPERVALVDFKSARLPPDDPAATPVAYLRQMAAYRAVLQAIRPGTPVDCTLVWTATGTVMALPDRLLDSHAPLAHNPAAQDPAA